MTQAETARLVAVLMAAFPSNRASTQTSVVYERMLADLDWAAANAAVERLLATSRFMPTVAEIRETTMALTVGEQKPGGEAWGEVIRMIGAKGYMRLPGRDFEFSDPTIARCVSLMGWERLCSSENETADRARFTELYDRLAVQDRRKELSEGLPAMQRYRAIEAAKTEERRQLRDDKPATVGTAISNVLALVAKSMERE